MATSSVSFGALVTLQELDPSSPHFKQGASLRVTGKLQDFDFETAIALIVEGNSSLKIDTQHLKVNLRLGSLYQFIGELLIDPNNEPSFEKILVQPGLDLKLSSSFDGILLPISQLQKSKKLTDIQSEITALDRASAEDALHPKPRIINLIDSITTRPMVSKDDMNEASFHDATFSMEDRLRSLGILSDLDGLISSSIQKISILKDLNLSVSTPQKKMKATISSLEPSEAYNLLEVLVAVWHSRSCPGKYVLPWISSILVNHNQFVEAQEPKTQLLDSLFKLSKSKEASIQSLLQLCGRL